MTASLDHGRWLLSKACERLDRRAVDTVLNALQLYVLLAQTHLLVVKPHLTAAHECNSSSGSEDHAVAEPVLQTSMAAAPYPSDLRFSCICDLASDNQLDLLNGCRSKVHGAKAQAANASLDHQH